MCDNAGAAQLKPLIIREVRHSFGYCVDYVGWMCCSFHYRLSATQLCGSITQQPL